MIGDVLVSSILCNNLKKAYPDSEIHYMVYASTTPVLEGNSNIDKIVLFTEDYRKSKIALFKFVISLRKENYDIIIDAYSKLESWLAVLLSNAKQTISYKKVGRTFLYTDNVERKKHAETNLGLAIEHRLSLLTPLDLKIDIDPVPKLYVTDTDREFADSLFQKYEISNKKSILMVAVTGSEILKTYPEEYMAKVVDFIADNYDVNILFNYNPVLKGNAESIYKQCKSSTKEKIFFDAYGKSLREYIAIMNASDLIMGNDGGAINMAKALDKPSFTIFSPWIPKELWGTFEDGKLHVSVHLNDFKPEVFQNKTIKDLKNNTLELYTEFNPKLILDKLKKFLDRNLKFP